MLLVEADNGSWQMLMGTQVTVRGPGGRCVGGRPTGACPH